MHSFFSVMMELFLGGQRDALDSRFGVEKIWIVDDEFVGSGGCDGGDLGGAKHAKTLIQSTLEKTSNEMNAQLRRK